MLLKSKLVIVSALFTLATNSLLSNAAEQTRWTFDGEIHNNSMALSPDESTAIVSISDQPKVIVYNLKELNKHITLESYITPRNIIFSPSGNDFYVSDSSLGVVNKIDTQSLKTIAQMPLGAGAFGTTISQDGKTLYVNNQAASTVTAVNLDTNQPKAVITGFAQPRQGVRLNPQNDKLFVTNFLGDKITIVNTATNKIESEITGFNKLRAISITQDGKTLFAANSGSNTIAVVDIDKRRIINTIKVGKDPYGAAITPDGKHVYSGNLGDNSLSEIDVSTMQVTATINGFKEPRQAIVFTHDGQYAYVLNVDLSISKLDLNSKKIVQTFNPSSQNLR